MTALSDLLNQAAKDCDAYDMQDEPPTDEWAHLFRTAARAIDDDVSQLRALVKKIMQCIDTSTPDAPWSDERCMWLHGDADSDVILNITEWRLLWDICKVPLSEQVIG